MCEFRVIYKRWEKSPQNWNNENGFDCLENVPTRGIKLRVCETGANRTVIAKIITECCFSEKNCFFKLVFEYQNCIKIFKYINSILKKF